MKKLLAAIVICIIAAVILIMRSENTLEKALAFVPEPSKQVIVHIEETDKGNIYFGTYDNYLATSFIKKGLTGYKNLYSGVAGDFKLTAERLGISYTYWPAIKSTSLPVYFGIVGNDEIDYIKVKGENRVDEAKIINNGDYRIWIMFMKGYKGSKFSIDGYSAEGNKILTITDDISPRRAQDKAMKSPYK